MKSNRSKHCGVFTAIQSFSGEGCDLAVDVDDKALDRHGTDGVGEEEVVDGG